MLVGFDGPAILDIRVGSVYWWELKFTADDDLK